MPEEVKSLVNSYRIRKVERYLSFTNDVMGEKHVEKDRELLRRLLATDEGIEKEARLMAEMAEKFGMEGVELDYENFRENNIPGGWNDDWSGEFELLRSDIYNTSAYYVRANATYESPLLLLSWLPWLGHYMEMERVYVSVLDVKSVHPYVELGYGFTTRLFSCGVFVGSGQGSRVFGCKFGFELFRRW